MHIRINRGTKFQLKLTILIFWTKFRQKGYFRSNTEKPHFCECPWSLLTILNFSVQGPTDTTANVSSPFSCRDNKLGKVLYKGSSIHDIHKK